MEVQLHPDLLTENLRHVLYDECDDDGCPVHHPVGAPGMNRRDLAMFVAGAQEAARLFKYASAKELGLPMSASYSNRMRAVEFAVRASVESWFFDKGKERKRKQLIKPRKKRVRQTFR